MGGIYQDKETKATEAFVEPWQNTPFEGAKGVVLWRGQVVSILRDDRPDIPFPAHWDLPGGGREGTESPFETFAREAFEETGLCLSEGQLLWQKHYPLARKVWFFVLEMPDDAPPPRLGQEGQRLALFTPEAFLALPNAIAHLQERYREFRRKGTL